MKKFLALAVVVALSFVAVGCGGTASSPATKADAAKPTEKK